MTPAATEQQQPIALQPSCSPALSPSLPSLPSPAKAIAKIMELSESISDEGVRKQLLSLLELPA